MIASSAIYGQMLLYFPELFENYTYFNMSPDFNDNYTLLPTSGYDGTDANLQVIVSGEVPYGTYLGIVFNEESNVKDSSGNLTYTKNEYLWAEEQLAPGKFIKWNNTTYRIMPTNEWIRQGAFTQYGIEKLVGSNGQGTVPSNLNAGAGNYS